MRNFEQPDTLLPNTFIVVRIDGRGFTKYVPPRKSFISTFQLATVTVLGHEKLKLGAAAATLSVRGHPHDRTKPMPKAEFREATICNILVTDRVPKTD